MPEPESPTPGLVGVDAMSQCPSQSDMEAEVEQLRAENQALTDQVAAYGRAVGSYHRAAHAMQVQRDQALALLRELVDGADDHRCWNIPGDIGSRARELLGRASATEDDEQRTQ